MQGYLMAHRDDPYAAVDNAAEWARRLVEIRHSGANVEGSHNKIFGAEAGGEDGAEGFAPPLLQ
jgi:hypothetical protein